MAQTDTSIYQNLLRPAPSAMDYASQYAQAEGQRQNLLMSRMKMDEYQRGVQEQNAIRSALTGLGANATPEQRANALMGTGTQTGYTMADSLLKSVGERDYKTAQTRKENSDADAKDFATRKQKYEFGVQQIQGAPDVASAVRMIQQGVNMGAWGMQEAQQSVQALQQAAQSGNPQALIDWKQNQLKTILAPKELMPTIQTRNTGGSTDTLAIDPFGSGAKVVSSVRNTPTPGDLITDARVRSEGAANRGVTMRGQDMADARTREAAAASLSKPFEVTGPDGNPLLVQQDKQGTIRPVSGYAPKQNNVKAPAEFTKAMTGVNELNRALDTYEQALKEAGGPSALAHGQTRAKLQGAYTSLKMGLKNAFELGALTGPDVGVLEGMLVDPTSPKMLLIGGKGVGEQIAQTRSYLKNREGALESTYQRTNPAKQGAPAAPGGWKIEEVK